jgi:hypothetical protein
MPLTVDVYMHHHLLFQLSACQDGAILQKVQLNRLMNVLFDRNISTKTYQ